MKNGFILSLDFELYWGSSENLMITNSLEEKYELTRSAIIKLLSLFQKYKLSATWATVGFLFAESKNELCENYLYDSPKYSDTLLSNFEKLKYIELENQNCFFALDLIKKINQVPNQEIATHTFSHYYVIDDQKSKERFEADLEKAQKIAYDKLGLKMVSIVFPRNQVCLLNSIKNQGIKLYRGNPKGWAYKSSSSKGGENTFKRLFRFMDRYIPISEKNCYDLNNIQLTSNIINVPASRFLAPVNRKLSKLERLRINRIKMEMSRAAKAKESYHLWWHPHNMVSNSSRFFENLIEIISHFNYLKNTYNWQSYSMKDMLNE